MNKPLRVLLVEDNPDDAHLIVDELTHAGYDVVSERVETAAAMRKALRGSAWNLVLADYALPSFNAAAALWLVKQVGYDVPFIIVSGTITDETAVAAMKAGAHDYVTKDHLGRLGPAVHRELAEAARRMERARLAKDLHREHDRFRTIVEKLPDALVIVDGDGRITFASPRLAAVVGYEPETWLGRTIFDFVHPDSVKPFATEFAAARERRSTPVVGTHRLRHENRGWACFAVACTNLLHEPAVEGIVVSLRDVSAEMAALEELRRKAEVLEAQLDAAADGVLIVDDAGHKLLQNRRLAEVLRVPPEIAAGVDDPQQASCALHNVRRPRDFTRRVAHLYTHPDEVGCDDVELKDGTILHRYSAPVLGRDGQRYGRMWVFHEDSPPIGSPTLSPRTR